MVDVAPKTFRRTDQPPRQNASADMYLIYMPVILGAFIAPVSIRRYDPPSAVNSTESFRFTE